MVTLKKDKQSIQEELSEILAKYYDGSFARMVSEYIHATGMTEAEVDALLEEMKHSITFVSWIRDNLSRFKLIKEEHHPLKAGLLLLSVCFQWIKYPLIHKMSM